MHNSPVGGNISSMTPRLRTLIDHAARLGEADAVLLRRFATSRDPQAFAELVRRYGRLVWGQCRNLLRSEADADDAFQATFLALATAARTLRDAHKLGPWLHGVAYRVCQQVKRGAGRRAKREKATAKAEAARPVPDSAWDHAFAAVHDELATLPDTLRVPFVVCVLEGKGTTEAAAQLGLKVGTLSARLSRAKQALLDRLTARGLTAGLATVGAVAVGTSNAPAAIVSRACDLAAGGTVPANILSLSGGALTMIATTSKRWAMAALVACGLAVGGVGVWQANAQDKPPLDEARKKLEQLQKVLRPDDKALKQAEEELKRVEAEAQLKKLDAARAAEALERARADAEDAKKAERAKKDKMAVPEFKYVRVGADFAPTTEEFEKMVKDGEQGGYTFVGVVTLAATTEKKPKGSTEALVFRHTPPKNVNHDLVLDLTKKVDDVARFNQKAKAADNAPTDAEKKLMAEIERLTKELQELKSKEKEKGFRGDIVVFPLANLAVEDFDSGVKLLAGMVRVKYGADGLKGVEFVRAPGGGVTVKGQTTEGNAVALWLYEQVKKMRDGMVTK